MNLLAVIRALFSRKPVKQRTPDVLPFECGRRQQLTSRTRREIHQRLQDLREGRRG